MTMGPFAGLSIQVISDGKPLKLYNDPDDEPANDPRTHQRYIEAVTGVTFKVKVSLHRQFKLYSLEANDAVRVTIHYDNSVWYYDYVVEDIRQAWSKGGPEEHTFGSITSFDEASQQWKAGATTFSALNTTDIADGKASLDRVKNIGRIKLEVDRVYRVKYTNPIYTSKTVEKPITEVSEKMLKGKAIVHTIGTTNETVSQAPPPSNYKTTPVPGVAGQTLMTLIFYRPRRTLQMLGCIPRSPSPDLEPSPTPGPSAADRERTIQDLRAQIALLEGNANLKAEGPNAKRRIKREIQDTEELQITEARSANKRVRRSGPTETVDLTED